jgi:hypothetical protein
MVGRRRHDDVLMAALGLAAGAGRRRRRRSQPALLVARGSAGLLRASGLGGRCSLLGGRGWPWVALSATAGYGWLLPLYFVAGWRRHGGGAKGGWCFSQRCGGASGGVGTPCWWFCGGGV